MCFANALPINDPAGPTRVTPVLTGARLSAALAACDAVAFCAAWISIYLLRDTLADRGIMNVPINPIRSYLHALWIYLPFWFGCAFYFGLYNFRTRMTGINLLAAILKCFLAGLCGSLAIAYLFKPWDIGRFILLLTAPVYCSWLYASRVAVRARNERLLKRGIGITRVLIVGVGRTARRVMTRITSHPEGGYKLVGFIDTHHSRSRLTSIDGYQVLGRVQDINEVLNQHPVDEVFLAMPQMPQSDVMNLVVACDHSGARFKIASNLFEVIKSQAQIDVIDDLPVVQLRNASLPPVQAALKRVLDLLVASILLLLALVPMLIIAVLIRRDSPGPAIFRQVRIGRNGRPFQMYKFRTMRSDTDPYAVAPGQPDDSRITRLGAWLRKTSIDEAPQLINVLIGDMSMVGPRPEMPFLVEKYSDWQRRRLDVKPGITGLWQIIGRKNLPLDLNIEYDFYYIKNQSLLFDIIILVKTIPAVIFGRGAF